MIKKALVRACCDVTDLYTLLSLSTLKCLKAQHGRTWDTGGTVDRSHAIGGSLQLNFYVILE